MFIPLHDANQLRHIKAQFVTIALIAANVLVYLGVNLNSEAFATAATYGFGYVPVVVNDGAPAPDWLLVPESATYLSYAFLHGNLLHLGGNMLFLWVFGDNVEDAMGHVKYLLFYLACAAAGAFVHGMIAPQSDVPLIGASGAVAGIIAAYLLLHPKVRIWVLALGRIPLRLPAIYPLLFWVGLQIFMLLADLEDGVSYAAHVGGLIAGGLLVLVLRRPGVPLFDREIVTPVAVEIETPPPPLEAPRWGRGREG
ncbi:MAG: rhomboid family intramembrane serine protease [Phyllobacteriaceae bacterium]|nr:rhomboid family intramembrane serine protease [Phyllobacteriaceae bacterium]